MEDSNQHVKFFRFRTRSIEWSSPTQGVMWLIGKIDNIDFTKRQMLKEAVLVCRETKGGFDYHTIVNFPFDEYIEIVKYADHIQPKPDRMNKQNG